MEISDFNFRDYFEGGEHIYGFCNGYFGRDDYNEKVVLMVDNDYVVFAYVEYTVLKEDDEQVEILEHTILDVSNMIKYSSVTDNSKLKKDTKNDFKTMFDSWKNPNQY